MFKNTNGLWRKVETKYVVNLYFIPELLAEFIASEVSQAAEARAPRSTGQGAATVTA